MLATSRQKKAVRPLAAHCKGLRGAVTPSMLTCTHSHARIVPPLTPVSASSLQCRIKLGMAGDDSAPLIAGVRGPLTKRRAGAGACTSPSAYL